MFLDGITDTKNIRLDILSDIIISGRDLWFLGVGLHAYRAKLVMDSFNIPVKGCCVDDEFYFEGQMFGQLPVERLSAVLANPDNKVLLITIASYEVGSKKKEQLNNIIPTYHCSDWYNWFKMDFAFALQNADRFEWLYTHLEDELSKDILVAYLQSHITGVCSSLYKLRNDSRWGYDYELLRISDQDIMLDCGCYDGDTILNVSDYLHGSLKKVFAFEPDENNRQKIYEAFSQNISDGSLEVIPFGCGEDSGDLPFFSDKGASSYFSLAREDKQDRWSDGSTFKWGEIVRIDDIIGNHSISWIKMDIEGSELAALKGARQTIIRNKPKLSICAYHRVGDLVHIPQFLESLTNEGVYYKYYLRHHSGHMVDTVLYALPR